MAISSVAPSLAGAQKAAGTARVYLTRVSSAVPGGSISTYAMLMISQFPGISYLQQSVTGTSGQAKETGGQGDTSHHAAVDEAHPEMISEFLRDQNRSSTK